MKKTIIFLLIVVALLTAVPCMAAEEITVAVMPFEGHEIRDWYLDREQMISGITEIVTDKLAELKGMKVVERTRLDQVILEQDFGHSGRADIYTAVEIGRLLGADVLIMGTINAIEVNSPGGFRIGSVALRGSSASIRLSARLVDVKTGTILGSVQGSGSESGISFSLDDLRGVSFRSETFRDSLLGKAITKAVDDLISNLEQRIGELTPGGEQLAGNILAVVGDKYIVNLGSVHNVRRGDRFTVFELVRVPGLSKPVEVPVGRLVVISVDEEACVCQAIEGVFKEGYGVRKED